MRSYQDPLYTEARKEVRKRDKYRCRMPGCSNKKKLQVHHIIPCSRAPHLRYEISNLITLCRDCHDSIKNQEHHYEALFFEIVNS